MPEEVRAPDVLSDVLRAVRLCGALFFKVEATAPWFAEAPASRALAPVVLPGVQHVVSYHVVATGGCWFEMPDAPALRLEAGDVVVIPHGDPYVLATTRGMLGTHPPELVLDWFRAMAAGALPFVVVEGGGGPQRIDVFCGFLGCDVLPFNPVLSGLPRAFRVRRPEGSVDRLGPLIEWAMSESREQRAGRDAVLLKISELLFLEVVRLHVATPSPVQTGWLVALRDPGVGRALALLHADPGRRWTVEALARETGVSRSALADRFAHLVGQPPMQYLSRWRMQRAAGMLADPDAKVASVALEVGYESEAAFSRAFKSLLGVPPARWRREGAGFR